MASARKAALFCLMLVCFIGLFKVSAMVAAKSRGLATYSLLKKQRLPVPTTLYPDLDAVVAYVDGHDPHWQADYSLHRTRHHPRVGDRDFIARFVSKQEIFLCLASLHRHIPWIRRIFIVIADHSSQQIDTSNFVLALRQKITFVTHRQLGLPVLPTFTSTAIETMLHKCPGIAQHFLYLNDDIFLQHSITRSAVFDANSRLYAPYPVAQSRNNAKWNADIWSGPTSGQDLTPGEVWKVSYAVVGKLLNNELGMRPQVFHHSIFWLTTADMEAAWRDFPSEMNTTSRQRFRINTERGSIVSPHHLSIFWGIAKGRRTYLAVEDQASSAQRGMTYIYNFQAGHSADWNAAFNDSQGILPPRHICLQFGENTNAFLPEFQRSMCDRNPPDKMPLATSYLAGKEHNDNGTQAQDT